MSSEAKEKNVTVSSAKPRARQVSTRFVGIKKGKGKKRSKAKSTAKPLSAKEIKQIKPQPLGHLIIEHTLREAGFHGVVSTEKDLLDKYSTDESIFSIRPQIVLQPKDRRDIEIAVEVLGREAEKFPTISLTPRAAGTGLSGGSLTDSIIIDVCAHLNRIGKVSQVGDKITVTCEPGAMWKDVEELLKSYDAYLPAYPASKDICSMGGAVSNNAAGPDSLRYGHVADWIESLEVTLYDGDTYEVRPLSYKEYQKMIKEKDHALGAIAKQILALIEKNEKAIKLARPKTHKNSAGYALWNVINTSVAEFKKGNGTFDLTQLIAGSQGTLGIITAITMRAIKIEKDTTLVVVPVFELKDASKVVIESLKYNPLNVEMFDGLTFDLALKNPEFFKRRLSGPKYYQVLFSMYTTYHVSYAGKTPEFTLLITLDKELPKDKSVSDVVEALRKAGGKKARVVKSETEAEMWWQLRRASFMLAKLKDPKKRPAPFLEDITVPPKQMAGFFKEIKSFLKRYNLIAAVHGHGGDGHFHFYPLIDFTNRTTPALIEKMAEEFFSTAVKYEGDLCGEHNDGIIRTPHLSKMFSKTALDLFKQTEHIFDPDDIFNPGKKVNPRFDIKTSIRKTN